MSEDAFTLLGLPRAFDLDQHALQAAYLRRSAALHPDRLTDELQRDHAQRESAALNDARAVLADDEQRANLLLALLGGPAKEHDKSLPDGFLMEMLDVRQDMEAALAGGEPHERERIDDWARTRRQRHIDSIRVQFMQLAATTQPDPESDQSPDRQPEQPTGQQATRLAAIRRELNAWRYIERMIEQLRDAAV